MAAKWAQKEPTVAVENPTNQTHATEWQPPELPENCIDVTLIWGGNFIGEYVTNAQKTTRPITFNSMHPFAIRVENNRVFVDCDFYTQEYGLTKIRGNAISPQLPQKWDMNTSSNALELVNELGTPMFQLFYRRPDEIAVNGIFTFGNEVWFASDRALERFGTNDPDFIKAAQNKFKEQTDRTPRIFKYPSWNHKGQMATNPN